MAKPLPLSVATSGQACHPFLPLQNTPLWCLSAGTARTASGAVLSLVAIVGGSGSDESKTGVGKDQISVCYVNPSTGALEPRAALELDYFPDSVFLSPDCAYAIVTTFNTARAYDIAGPSREWDRITAVGSAVFTEEEVALHSDLKRCKVAFHSAGTGNVSYDFFTAGGGGAIRRWTIAQAPDGTLGIVPQRNGQFLNAASAEVHRDLLEIAQLKRRLNGGTESLTQQWTKLLVREATLRNTGQEADANALKATIDGMKAEIDGINGRIKDIEQRGSANKVIADVAAAPPGTTGLVAVVREHGSVEVYIADSGELLFSKRVVHPTNAGAHLHCIAGVFNPNGTALHVVSNPPAARGKAKNAVLSSCLHTFRFVRGAGGSGLGVEEVGAIVVGRDGNPAAAVAVTPNGAADRHVVAVSFKTGHLWVARALAPPKGGRVLFSEPIFNSNVHVLPARSVAFTRAVGELWPEAGALAAWEPVVTIAPDCKAILTYPSTHGKLAGGTSRGARLVFQLLLLLIFVFCVHTLLQSRQQ
eukprot:INCI16586.2.p1 GENE.INCI16586.2~~INCI16586.2.p1  ORF type:complete len:531 (+),score=84.93 INCI16586.2:525-2117(+)